MLTYRTFKVRKMNPQRKTFEPNGAITACCDVDEDKKEMRVGFSFLSPIDQHLYLSQGRKGRRTIVNKGQGIAKQRMLSGQAPDFVVISGLERNGDGKLKITEALVRYLKSFKGIDKMTFGTGAGAYYGTSSKEVFWKWFQEAVALLHDQAP